MSDQEKEEFSKLPFIELEDLEDLHYLQTISEGWAYPLDRFMNEQEFLEMMNMNMVRDQSGNRCILSVPITLHVTNEQKKNLEQFKQIAIKCSQISPDVLAVIYEPEFFTNRKEEICAKKFGTSSKKHPKIEKIWNQGDWLISGKSMRFT